MDALGALLTAIILFGILAPLSTYFGMPKHVLYLLSGIAISLFIYSSVCSKFIKSNWKPFLKIILVLNAIYLLISIYILIKHAESITELGWVYFSIEFLVIGIVLALEIKTLKRLNPIH
jgi:uncharacterized membrane protein (DUF2068 family)